MGVTSRKSVTPSQPGLSVTSSTVVVLKPPHAAMVADIYVRTASVVFTRDATNPTATQGKQANAGDIINLYSRSEVENFRVIAVGTTASLDVEYFTDVSG